MRPHLLISFVLWRVAVGLPLLAAPHTAAARPPLSDLRLLVPLVLDNNKSRLELKLSDSTERDYEDGPFSKIPQSEFKLDHSVDREPEVTATGLSQSKHKTVNPLATYNRNPKHSENDAILFREKSAESTSENNCVLDPRGATVAAGAEGEPCSKCRVLNQFVFIIGKHIEIEESAPSGVPDGRRSWAVLDPRVPDKLKQYFHVSK